MSETMNALDSPLEALAFNYLSYGFFTAVNSIWPWIAVLTAALSFWRIRASSCRTPDDAASTTSSPLKKDAAVTAAPEKAEVSPSTKFEAKLLSSVSKRECSLLERQGSTKGKFTLYFCGKDVSAGGDHGCGNGGAPTENGKLGRRRDDWEGMMVVRMGDMGWYQYQDLTVLDGNVVRLWDSRRRRNAAVGSVGGGVTW